MPRYIRSMKMFGRIAAALLGPLLGCASAAGAQEQPPPADPLSVKIDISAVDRFVALWKKTNGNPTAADLDADYIKGGGEGVKVFTPARIIDGANMAKQIVDHGD